MRRIAHISDLHFGAVEPGLDATLLDRLAGLAPDLVAVSGDLTQRARASQFRAARAFLDRLPAPWLSVPGNHDIPLWNLVERVLTPFARYRRHICEDLEPIRREGGVVLAGVNTVDPFAHQAGHFRREAIVRLERLFADAPTPAIRVAVGHHPLVHAPGTDKAPMRNADEALARLGDCCADIVLSGHLHAWDYAAHKALRGVRETLLIQAGTAISSRRRGRENDFNLLALEGDAVRVERYVADDGGAFALRLVQEFRRDGEVWKSLGPVEHDLP